MPASSVTPWTVCSLPGSCPWDFPGKNTRMGYQFLLQGNLPDPGIELTSPALADGFFITEPPEKPFTNHWASLVLSGITGLPCDAGDFTE